MFITQEILHFWKKKQTRGLCILLNIPVDKIRAGLHPFLVIQGTKLTPGSYKDTAVCFFVLILCISAKIWWSQASLKKTKKKKKSVICSGCIYTFLNFTTSDFRLKFYICLNSPYEDLFAIFPE